jgi:hypothetical protein
MGFFVAQNAGAASNQLMAALSFSSSLRRGWLKIIQYCRERANNKPDNAARSDEQLILLLQRQCTSIFEILHLGGASN